MESFMFTKYSLLVGCLFNIGLLIYGHFESKKDLEKFEEKRAEIQELIYHAEKAKYFQRMMQDEKINSNKLSKLEQ